MERRAVLKVIAWGAILSRRNLLSASSCPGMNMPPAPGPYKLQFFTDKENHLVDQLMELIIPADSHSPGAHAAEVSLFADSMVAASDERVENEWREGLRLIEEKAAVSPLEKVLSEAASGEEKPGNELQRFFVILKRMTINGYYTSKIGIHQDLRYIGNDYVSDFPGCTHPGHQGM